MAKDGNAKGIRNWTEFLLHNNLVLLIKVAGQLKMGDVGITVN